MGWYRRSESEVVCRKLTTKEAQALAQWRHAPARRDCAVCLEGRKRPTATTTSSRLLVGALISPYIYSPWGPPSNQARRETTPRLISKKVCKAKNARLNYYSAHGLAGAPATSLMLTHRWRQRHLLIELIRRPTNRKR